MKRGLVIRALVSSVVTWLSFPAVDGSTIASWHDPSSSSGVPQLIFLNYDHDTIYYSLCNSTDLPVFPRDERARFNLYEAPAHSDHVAGFTFRESGVLHVAIFYQTKSVHMVGEVFRCEEDGYYSSTSVESWDITDDTGLSPRNGSGIAALYLPETRGYRLFYQNDETHHIIALRYTPSERIWRYDGTVSQDETLERSISAGVGDSGQITVVGPRADNKAIEVMTFKNSTWAINTFPCPLLLSNTANDTIAGAFVYEDETACSDVAEGFNSSTKPSIVFDSSGARSVYYLGWDRELRRFQEVDGEWQVSDSEDPQFWPTSEFEAINFGYAFDSPRDKIWIYYFSGGEMVQVHQSSLGTWEDAVPLPSTWDEALESSPQPPSPESSRPSDGDADEGDGLSRTPEAPKSSTGPTAAEPSQGGTSDEETGGDQDSDRNPPSSPGSAIGKGLGMGLGLGIGIPVAAVTAIAARVLHKWYTLRKQHVPMVLADGKQDSIYELPADESPLEMPGDGHLHEMVGSDVREMSAD